MIKRLLPLFGVVIAGVIVGVLGWHVADEVRRQTRKTTFDTFRPDDSMIASIPKVPDALITFEEDVYFANRVRSVSQSMAFPLERVVHDESPVGLPISKRYLIASTQSVLDVVAAMDESAAASGCSKDAELCQDLQYGHRRVYRYGEHRFLFVVTGNPELLNPPKDDSPDSVPGGYYAASVACTLERKARYDGKPMAWEPTGIRSLPKDGKLSNP